MLTPWKESYDQPRQHIKQQRHYFVNKDLSSQGCGFSSSFVWMWELDHKEGWVLKNRCFWTVSWRGLLMSSFWLARISNHSILKEISPEYSLEELMLKLKLQYFDLLMWTAHSLGKALMLGKFEGRSRGQQRMRWLDGITDSIVMSLSKLGEIAKDSEACHAVIHGSQRVKQYWATEQQQCHSYIKT